jgi:RNA polymerase sigma factor (sigma-70 family)
LADPLGHLDSHERYRRLQADRRIPRPVEREEAGVGEPSAAELVAAAVQGESSAWDELVGRYSGLVWSVARAHRLSTADAADVTQTVWMRLVEHLGRIRDPAHVGGWLATTTRHECLRVLRRSGREVLDDFTAIEQPDDPRHSPEWVVLSNESRRLVWLALGRLSQRCQMLLRTLSASPDASYAEVSAALGIPIGSIGPTRMRCLEYLRKQLAQDGGLLDNGDG